MDEEFDEDEEDVIITFCLFIGTQLSEQYRF